MRTYYYYNSTPTQNQHAKSEDGAHTLSKKEEHAPFFNGQSSDRNAAPFFSSGPIQTKSNLTIGQPGDKYEVEADAMADQVVQKMSLAGSASSSNNESVVQRTCSSCAEEEKVQTKEEPLANQISGLQRKPIFESEEDSTQNQVQRMCESCEEEDIQKKDDNAPEVMTKPDQGATSASTGLQNNLQRTKGKGAPMSENTRSGMESSFGADFSKVRIHTDSQAVQMNKELNAQAFSHGEDIYFNEGKYNTDSSKGKHLLAHELTHTIQQSKDIQREMIQRDLGSSIPTSNGIFEIEMRDINGADATPATTQANVDTSIKFMPATTAPYSNDIRLIQIVRDRDTAGNEVNISSLPHGRGASLRTTEDAAAGVEGGFFTDVLHQNFNAAGPTTVAAPGSQKRLNYEGATPVFGFKRSNDPKDIKAAEITDTPGSAGDRNFNFETVAKGEDTNQLYGALHWAFSIRSGSITNESATAENLQSATYDAAVERHRDFYVHEPLIFYFSFDGDVVAPTEADKIDNVLDYLRRFPDVRLSLEGYADRRGNADYNLDLSLRRANNVRTALIAKGIDENRIEDIVIGRGATEQFTSGNLAPNAGQDQDLEANRRGNRRVVLTFTHTASVSGP